MITSRILPRQLTLPLHPPAELTPSLSYFCSLFALFSALPSFRINHLQPLFGKHPGWGYPNASMGHLEPLSSDKGRRRNCSSITSFRINTCKSVSKQRTLTTFRINTYEKRGEGGGGTNWNLRDTLAVAITCATWRLYLLWSQSIAHTSCHHRGVPNPLPLFTSRPSAACAGRTSGRTGRLNTASTGSL